MFAQIKGSKAYSIAFLYLSLFLTAELVTTYSIKLGILIHSLILFSLLIHSVYSEYSKFLTSLTLIPVIRVLSISLPHAFTFNIWLMIIGVCIISAAFTCMYIQGLKPMDVGLSLPQLNHLPLEIAIIGAAIPLGFAEYIILKQTVLTTLLTPSPLIPTALIIIVSTGFAEELVFRGLIQHNAVQSMGFIGIPFVALVFGFMHVGNSLMDVLFATGIGAIYSLIVEKTGSIYGVSISHGVINIVLFMIAPTL